MDSVLLAKMPTTLTALIKKLKGLGLSRETREAHTSMLTTLVRELKLSDEQLKAVGNEALKLTVKYQAKWDEDRAKLAGLPSKAVELAKKHDGDLLAINYCDKLTLLYSKEHYGRLLDLLVGTQDCAVYWASADMDNFKLINDEWSHAHGDFAIIQTGLIIGEAVAAWNLRHEGVAHCDAFRMGGDEVCPTQSGLTHASRTRVALKACARIFARSLSSRCSCRRARWASLMAR